MKAVPKACHTGSTMQTTPDIALRTATPTIVIEAGHTERNYWRDLWSYRELLGFLAWRDISVRYKQTILGIAWVVLRPLLTMIVFTVVFGKLAGLSSGQAPYPAMVFAGMLPWQLFATTLTDSGNSILNNGGMVSKVYFPRLLMPLSAAVVALVDFLVAAVLLAITLAIYGVLPGWRILMLPLFIANALAISVGVGLWVSALNVRYRDFRFIVTFGLQLGLYVSPVGFRSAIIPEQWRLLYACNPMVGVIDGFRWALLGDATPLYWPGTVLSAVLSVLLLVSAVAHFRRAEKSFADNI